MPDTTERLRVVIADDHPFYRDGLAGLLRENDVDVVAEVPNGDAAVHAVHEHQPDVVVMDLNMPGVGGLEATRRLAEESSRTKILVLTVSQDEEDIVDAMLAGASGYVVKDGPVNDVVAGIKAASTGRSFLSPRIAPLLLERARASSGVPVAARLSKREQEVLTLLAQNRTAASVASELSLSEEDLRMALASILLKLQAQNRAQAAVQAVRDRIV
jgi:DNA-binding NarL/FixJ family response regulator